MFDKEMSAAVDTAQKRLMNTTGKDSVLMSVASDLKELCTLTSKLDPSNINLDKGGLEKIKAIGYWNRFEKYYPDVKVLFDRLVRSRKILFNSKTTINRFYQEFEEAYNNFRSVPENEQDGDYVQQAIISANVYQLLKNSVSEHETVYTHLDKVLNVLETSLDMAIYLARKNAGFDLGSCTSATLGNISNSDYQMQFSRLNSLLK